MKSPLREPAGGSKSIALLKEKIPAGSVVDSFLFLGGEIECNLADNNRFVVAHTSRYVIYEFWRCILGDAQRVADIVTHLYPLDSNAYHSKRMFYLLQENWPTYKDPFMRSALFYLLNRCSQDGHISAGEFADEHLTSRGLSQLRAFTVDNLHVSWDQSEDDFMIGFEKVAPDSTLLIRANPFSYNYFEEGKSKGFEMTTLYHKDLANRLQQLRDRKWIVIYDYHKGVSALYPGSNIQMINQYGRPTEHEHACKELLIANF